MMEASNIWRVEKYTDEKWVMHIVRSEHDSGHYEVGSHAAKMTLYMTHMTWARNKFSATQAIKKRDSYPLIMMKGYYWITSAGSAHANLLQVVAEYNIHSL